MESLTFYKMLSFIYAFLLGALQRISLYHQLFLHSVRKAEAEGLGQLIMAESSSDSDSMQETASIRELKEGDNNNEEEYDDDQEDKEGPDAENTGFSLGTMTPGSPRLHGMGASGRRRIALANRGSNLNSPRDPFGAQPSPAPLVRELSSLRLEDEEGCPSDGAQLFRQLETESEEILFAVADLAHSRCAKLIGMRSEQTAKLLPAEVYRLLKLTWSFVLQSELLSGYMCYGLRTAILSQVKIIIMEDGAWS